MERKNLILLILFIGLIILKINSIDSKKFIKDLIENNTDIKFTTNKKNKNIHDKIIIINNNNMFNKIATKGELGFAESYMNGEWETNNLEGVLYELISKFNFLTEHIKKNSLTFVLMEIKLFLRNLLPNNTLESSPENIAMHYDVGNKLYEKMLGKYMQYTCAYFNKPNMTLDEAQYAKMELVAKKLDLKPNMKVIDLGCGFGALAYHLAKKYKVKVTGVTLSKKQKEYADKHYKHPNVKIELKDYRNVKGKFDRVYSVGILEHIGRKNYTEYYNKCYSLLKNNGIMFVHSICTSERIWNSNGFISKYIFPEGELPHLENLTGKFLDKWHLEDVQNIGLSYEKTLKGWYNNIGNWSGLENYDKRFRKMWEYYLIGCAVAFKSRNIFLLQMVYTKRYSTRKDDCHHIRA